MRAAGMPDVFIVMNGPQDGAEFPIGSPAIQIGSENSCAVNLQLDQNVQGVHAIATAMGSGYTIRATTNAPVIVEGKKATQMKSRVIRPGEMMRVGYTDLLLECSPDGMSSRSQGISVQNDFGFAANNIGKSLLGILKLLWRLVLLIPKWAMRHWILTIIILFVASKYLPGLDRIFDTVFGEIVGRINSFIANMRQ